MTGKHRATKCRTCHNIDYVDLDVLRRAKVQDPNRTFLGLPTECARCHSDPHRGQVGADCARCHSTETFDDVSKFDHQQTKLPLTGRHLALECSACHRETDGFVELNGFASVACRSCHADPHQGAFSAACDSCHTTTNWAPSGQSKSFDHSATEFPLLGKHEGLSCRSCHSGANFREPVAHALCKDCHTEDDPHKDQFAARSDAGECGACHVVEGFTPSTFSLQMHQETQYPLTGKHADVECESCHASKGPDTVFKFSSTACEACHDDAHAGDFEGPPHENRCADCHTVFGFQPSTFTLEKHQKSRSPLVGSHLAVACDSCHAPTSNASLSRATFHFGDLGCTNCHNNPHTGQFHAVPGETDSTTCGKCHDVSTWHNLRQFDHGRTKFALEGAHRTVACAACHRRTDGSPGIAGVVFADAPVLCSGCHEDIHDGQFDVENQSQTCSECHRDVDWRPTRFDHRAFSAFPLKGAHEEVPCRMCHERRRSTEGSDVIVYRGTPRECEACHTDKL